MANVLSVLRLFVQVVDAGARELGQGHRVVHVQDDRMKFLEV